MEGWKKKTRGEREEERKTHIYIHTHIQRWYRDFSEESVMWA